jgi:peptidoglycan/LPS O-acetylase OafA/YrhL
MLLVYFILQLLGYLQISNSSWFTALTYTKYFNWNLDWVTSHGWSLSIEEHFYLFWPFVFLGGETFRKRFTIFIILLVPFIRIFTHYYPVDWINELTFFERIDAIAIGCLFSLYKNEILNLLSKHLTWLFYASVALLIVIPYVPELTKSCHLEILIIGFIGTDNTLGNLLIALILMYSVFGSQTTLWFKFLNLKWINFIGMLSYSIYLWQQFFINDTSYWYNQYPLNIVYMFLMAILSYYLIEKPFLKLKTKF